MEDRNGCSTLRNVWHLGVGVGGHLLPPFDIPGELRLSLNTARRRDGEFTLELCGGGGGGVSAYSGSFLLVGNPPIPSERGESRPYLNLGSLQEHTLGLRFWGCVGLLFCFSFLWVLSNPFSSLPLLSFNPLNQQRSFIRPI